MPHAAGLWYEWHGPEDGEVLILSAGLGGSASYWAPNLQALARRYRILVYDHRGTGRSDKALPDSVTIGDMARDVAVLMAELGIDRPNFLGHALGGAIGLELSLAGNALAKLVVVGGWARLDPHTARCFDVRLELLRHSGPEAYLRAQPIFLYPADWSSERSAAIDAELKAQLAHFPGAATVEKRIAALAALDIADRLHEIALPVLVIGARDDMLVPPRAIEALADGLPNAGLGMQAFGGHACNITYPDSFNGFVLGWLAGEFPGEKE